MMRCLEIILFVTSLALAAVPPETWKENWFEHNQVVTRVFHDNEVAIYFDRDVDRSSKWMNKYLHDVWAYTKRTYGQFGSDPHLYAIFHAGRYSGGHPGTYFDASKSYRNTIDCGANAKDAWKHGGEGDLSITTHEVAHIVEFASKGVHNSPAFPIWGDSKWAEIYIYDVYEALGRKAEAKKWRDAKLKTSDSFPRPNTFWFRDWFLPIYERHGRAKVLNGFFEVLSRNFPKANRASQNRPQYTRNMNMGEFVHFWSGAARTNLKNQAAKAFGWPAQYEKEFNQARKDFPNIKY